MYYPHTRRFIFIIFLFITFSKRIVGQNIIAYYSGNAKQIGKYPVNKLTHIIFSFCHIQGNRLWVSDRGDSLTIRSLVKLKKKKPSLKILLSLGGWGGCETCSDVFSTDSGRIEFAESVRVLSDYFHTDGIDIDWEFPSLAAFPGHPFQTDDRTHLTFLIQMLRRKLGKTQEISVICAGFSPYLQGSLDLRAIAPYVDRIHLMTYDLVGSQTYFTGHISSLYSTEWQKESTDHAVRYLDSLMIPLNKISVGIPFYGRQYRVSENHDHGLHQPAKFEKFVTMRQIRKNYTDIKGYISYWDAGAKATYKYYDRKKIFLTYDDERSVTAKTTYVKAKELNGIFFWELRLDKPNHGLLYTIAEGLQK